MYESMQKYHSDFHLYAYLFDQKALEVLSKLELPNITLITLADFEDSELLSVKPTRTKGEYCWTCTPSIILHTIEKFGLHACTYVDADLYFYDDSSILIDEMGDSSVLITEHRYTYEYDLSAESGKYCVQFLTFKNDSRGMQVLRWWRQACLEWCYNRHEDGKFGDQKYLDNWLTKFDGVYELQNLGGGVAPWNIQQYKVVESEGQKFIKEYKTQKIYKLVFFHFHDFKFYTNNFAQYTGKYYIPKSAKELIYKSYIQHLALIKAKIGKIDSSFDPHGASLDIPYKPYTVRDKIWILKDEFIRAIKYKDNLSLIAKIKRTYRRLHANNIIPIINIPTTNGLRDRS